MLLDNIAPIMTGVAMIYADLMVVKVAVVDMDRALRIYCYDKLSGAHLSKGRWNVYKACIFGCVYTLLWPVDKPQALAVSLLSEQCGLTLSNAGRDCIWSKRTRHRVRGCTVLHI